MSVLGVLYSDWELVAGGSALRGWDWLVWTLTLCNAAGGLAIASVIKYADNIAKAFVQASAILTASAGSALLFHTRLTPHFALGAALVILAIGLHATFPPTNTPSSQAQPNK